MTNAIDAVRAAGIGPARHADGGYVALIDSRILERECLAHSLNFQNIGWRVLTFAQIEEWQDAADVLGMPSAVVFNTGHYTRAEATDRITEVVQVVAPSPVVVLSSDQDINVILDAIASGVKGYIPSSVNIDICIKAISLAIAGGRFIPASSLLGMPALFGLPLTSPSPSIKFTNRQSAIAEALRCGKANKDIAYEMNLCESTIKVHVRNIMRKLGATNRTEVACKMGDMVFDSQYLTP
jgi:DNA-binding NarL/FixJ family response regulator